MIETPDVPAVPADTVVTPTLPFASAANKNVGVTTAPENLVHFDTLSNQK